MATKKKLLQAAAGTAAAGGGAGGLSVENVFSTYLYEGNGSSQVIENGINLGQSNSGGSVEFDGSGDYLKTSSSSDFAFGNGDYTMEAWIYPTSVSGTQGVVSTRINALADTTQVFFGLSNSAVLHYGGTGNNIEGGTVSANEWSHIACSRSGSTVRVFLNGTQVTSGTDSDTKTTTFGYVAAGGGDNSQLFQGYVSNARIVKGTALYTANFTVPTSELTAVSGTSLLTCQETDSLTDNSSSAHTITVNGDPKASTFGPFDAAEAGEGGLVWIKDRTSGSHSHVLYDTNRGINKALLSDSGASELTRSSGLTSFNSNGFSVGSLGAENNNGSDFASWTWRKAPRFFDCVQYTGNGIAGRTISHNLGSEVGCIILKKTSSTSNWFVYHRGMDATAPEDYRMQLNTTDGKIGPAAGAGWNETAPTSTEFTVHSGASVNASGDTYVAYLFAHNDGDGEFGDGTQDIIKCGSYTTDGSGVANVDLGFEPQFVIIKRTSAGEGWIVADTMRGISTGGNENWLFANTNDAEASSEFLEVNSTGFKYSFSGNTNETYIYIAIRRGPMAVPTDATEVFAMDGFTARTTGSWFRSGFPVDFAIRARPNNVDEKNTLTRIIGAGQLRTDSSAAETTSGNAQWDYMDGYADALANSSFFSWMWKRAPSFCDVVAYTGNQVAGLEVSHNLGVAPEMIWIKNRDSAEDWSVWHKDVSGHFILNSSSEPATDVQYYFGDNTSFVAPTSTVITLGTHARVNYPSGTDYIAYVFASVDGVSKVGSFTGNGSTLNVDCGFSSGARFVIIKKYSGPWRMFDTERGIVAGNDPFLLLNNTDAQVTSVDLLDPYSSGFSVNYNGDNAFNVSGETYIFYAIA